MPSIVRPLSLATLRSEVRSFIRNLGEVLISSIADLAHGPSLPITYSEVTKAAPKTRRMLGQNDLRPASSMCGMACNVALGGNCLSAASHAPWKCLTTKVVTIQRRVTLSTAFSGSFANLTLDFSEST